MTRINVIEPASLADQHLIAEYRELPRVFALARPLTLRERVPAYRLGAGHVKFFYDLTGWLASRQVALIAECQRRGFSVQHTSPPAPVPGLDGDWLPPPEAVALNLARLRDKLLLRPGFYRYCGKVVGQDFYAALALGKGGEQ